MRPLVRCVTSSAHWNAPSESGIGRLPTTESLYSDLSVCARDTHGIAMAAPAAAVPSRRVRRVVLIIKASSELIGLPVWVAGYGQVFQVAGFHHSGKSPARAIWPRGTAWA